MMRTTGTKKRSRLLSIAGVTLLGLAGCAHAPPERAKGGGGGPPPWPADAVFQAYPVIHCTTEEVPKPLLDDVARYGQGKTEETAREVYASTRDLVLTTLNLFLATGRWAQNHPQIAPTRELPRTGTQAECRMFELALADQISLRLPPSVSGAQYVVPVAMFGYDYEPSGDGKRAPRVTVRIAALLARGDGHVLRTLRATATSDYALMSPNFAERSSAEIAKELTEELFRKLSQAVSE